MASSRHWAAGEIEMSGDWLKADALAPLLPVVQSQLLSS